MAESKTVTVINKVVQKTATGQIPATDMSFGVDFENVIDTRQDKDNKHYSLAQFFDNYMKFAENYTFIAKGPKKPDNKRALIWIDTSQGNQN